MSTAATLSLTIDYPCRGILAASNVIFYMIVALGVFLESPWYSLKRFWMMVNSDPSKIMETCVALFCALPGGWMVLSSGTPKRHWDDLLEAVMPLWIYGAIFLSITVLIAISLHFDILWGRRIGQGLACLVHLFLLLFFATMFRHFLVVPLLPPIVIMAAWSWWRLGRTQSDADRPNRQSA